MKDSDYAMLRTQEVIDDMSQALAGLAKSLNKTKAMVECIQKTKQADQFKEDCEEMMKAHDAKKKEYEALLAHRDLLKQLVARQKNAAEPEKTIIAETVLALFVAFNVIQEDALEHKEA